MISLTGVSGLSIVLGSSWQKCDISLDIRSSGSFVSGVRLDANREQAMRNNRGRGDEPRLVVKRVG